MIRWLRSRRPWTLAVQGQHSGRVYPMPALWRFRTEAAAQAKADELNGRRDVADTAYIAWRADG